MWQETKNICARLGVHSNPPNEPTVVPAPLIGSRGQKELWFTRASCELQFDLGRFPSRGSVQPLDYHGGKGGVQLYILSFRKAAFDMLPFLYKHGPHPFI